MAEYLNPSFGPTDPDDIIQAAFDYLTEAIPGFTPADGNPGTWLIMALAHMVATAADVAPLVATSIFRYYGQSVVGLQPIDAVVATTTVTVTANDDAGYTLDAGSSFGYQVAGDTVITFRSTDDVTIPPGETSTAEGAVQIVAVNAGTAGNGLGPEGLVLLDALGWPADVTALAATGGGVDAEDDAAYLSRLVDEVRLFTPTPILGQDFAVMARNVGGVARAAAIDNYNPGHGPPPAAVVVTPHTTGGYLHAGYEYTIGLSTVTGSGESQLFTFKYTPPAGTDTNTIDITWTAPPADSELDAITGYHAYRDDPTAPGVLRSGFTLFGSTAATIGGNAYSALTHAPQVTDGTEKTGVERAVAVACIDAAGQPVSPSIKAAVKAYLESLRELNFRANVFDAVYTTLNVLFNFTSNPGQVDADVKAAAETAVGAYLNPATYGIEDGDNSGLTWNNDPTIRYNEIVTLLNNVPGLRWVNSLTINGVSTDVVMPGRIALPRPGVITGTPS